MRSARSPPSRARSARMRPNPSWVEAVSRARGSMRAGSATRAAACRLGKDAAKGAAARNASSSGAAMSRPAKRSHSSPRRDAHLGAKNLHLAGRHQPGMIVLVPGEGEAVALGGVADQAGRPVVADRVEGIQQHADVVAREVGHQRVQRRVVAPGEQAERIVVAGEIARQPLAPPRAALEGERRIERVGGRRRSTPSAPARRARRRRPPAGGRI